MSASTPLSPAIVALQKPQAKSLSPVSRNLFGNSEASVVAQMLNEVLMTERRRAASKLNFDIDNQKPMKVEQQENINDVDKTPEPRKRYVWKTTRPGEAPEFYTRRYKGKKSLMPVDLLNCSPESANANGRSRSVRRSLNGYLRTPSKELQQKSIIRPSSVPRFEPSPLRVSSPLRAIDTPASFDESMRSRIPAPVIRPLAVHASTENAFTAKVYTPAKSVACRFITRSPLSQRENQSRSARALDFTSTPKKSPLVTTSQHVQESTADNSMLPIIATPSTAEKTLTPIIATPRTNMTSAPSSLKQLKLTDMATMRKPRSPAQRARKRLNLSEESSSNVPSTKAPRLARGGN